MSADSRSEAGLDVGLGRDREPAEARSDSPFCLLVIGAFGGNARERGPLRQRRPVSFDRDDVDEALARLTPTIRLSAMPVPLTLDFRSLEDFHPDRLYADVPVFASLRELRDRAVHAPPPPPSSPPGGTVLDRILADTPGSAPAPTLDAVVRGGLGDFVREAVRRHIEPSPDPRQAAVVSAIDEAIAEQMRLLLRDPAFQALESAWRTIERLARRVDTSSMTRLYLLDVSAAELDAALDDAPAGSSVQLAELLAATGAALPGGAGWSAVVVLREFGSGETEDARLFRLALFGEALGAPVLADAAAARVGLDSWSRLPDPRAWQIPGETRQLAALHASAGGGWLCLAAPRVLLREPYGPAGEPVEAFAFAEIAGPHDPDAYLWGSGAAVCGLLLAQNFSERGWSMQPRQNLELDGLPLCTDPEGELVPCAETTMTERAAESLLEAGIAPIAWLKGSGAVRVLRFHAVNGHELHGKWARHS